MKMKWEKKEEDWMKIDVCMWVFIAWLFVCDCTIKLIVVVLNIFSKNVHD